MVATLVKGGRWRRAVEVFLNDHGFSTVPRGLGYAGDDITATRRDLALSIEAKNHQRWAPAAWVDQAVEQAPKGAVPVVFAHRRGKTRPADGYVIMRGKDFITLIGDLDA